MLQLHYMQTHPTVVSTANVAAIWFKFQGCVCLFHTCLFVIVITKPSILQKNLRE